MEEMKIRKHCVKLFKERYGSYPSIVNTYNSLSGEVINKLIDKSHLLWYNDYVDLEGEINNVEKLVEYDSTGIFIYIKNGNVLFLTTINKKNIVDFTLHNLIKKSK
jgi:hypothetical protein